MSQLVLFLIVLLVGALLLFLAGKIEGSTKFVLYILGTLVLLTGGYGIFTALL